MSETPTWFMFLLLGYFGTVMVLARVFSRQINNLKDFFQAGRSLSAWPIAIAFVSSWFGAGSTMGSINAFHDKGISGLWYIFIPSALACLAITFFLARKVAARSEMTQPEAISHYYGKVGRALLSIIILISITNFIASQMVAAGMIFQTVFGLDILTATLICTSVVLGYSLMGGFFAVVVTDFAQLTMVILALLTLLIAALFQLSDLSHLQTTFQSLPTTFWQITGSGDKSLLDYACTTLTFVLAWCLAPEMWQRMTSSKNPDLAVKATRKAVLILLCLYAVVTTIGILSPASIGGSKAVMIDLALQLPHPLLSALVIIGFIAAVTSTMDSSLNVGSLTLTRDIYQGFLRPDASEKELLWASRIGLLIIAIPAISIAVAFQDIIHILWMSADVYASAMFIPVMGILFAKNPRPLSGILAMSLGLGFALTSMAFQYNWLDITHIIPITWPKAPYSTLLGVTLSGLGFQLGQMLPVPEAKNSSLDIISD